MKLNHFKSIFTTPQNSNQIFQTAGNTHGLRKALGILESHHIGQGYLRACMRQERFGLATIQTGPRHLSGRQGRLGLFGAQLQKVKGILLGLFGFC